MLPLAPLRIHTRSDTMENINKKESMKLWKYFHENKVSLTCFQGDLF